MKKLITFALICCLFLACKNEKNEALSETMKTETVEMAFDLNEAKNAIAASNKSYGEGFAMGDVAMFTSKYTKDACIMPANAPKMCGTEALGMFYNGAIQMGVKNIILTTEEVMGGPEVVVETGTYELLGENNASLDKGKFIVAWKMEDGQWKMHRDMFTTDGAMIAK